MNWTKIADTEIGKLAWKTLKSSDCKYHNDEHVMSMYDYLANTNEPYDEALDWAVLFHDVVYDEQPDKEARSAEYWFFLTCDLPEFDHIRLKVCDLIMATEKHYVTYPEWSAIIRADLHALTNPVQVVYNYIDIMEESIWLYRINEVAFADNNIKFMSELYKRVDMNMDLDISHREFYKDVKRGITSTINLSRILKGDL